MAPRPSPQQQLAAYRTRAPKPVEAEVLALRTHLLDRDKGRNNRIATNRKHRFGQVEVFIPDAYKETTTQYRIPQLGDHIDRTTAALTVNPWALKITKRNESRAAGRDADDIELWGNGAFTRLEHQRGQPTRYLVTDSQVGTGWGACKVLHAPDAWRAYPRARGEFQMSARDLDEDSRRELTKRQERYKEEAAFPFTWSDCDPASVHAVDDGGVPVKVVEERDVEALPMVDRYGLVPSKQAGKLCLPTSPNASDPDTTTKRLPSTCKLTEYWCVDPPDPDTGERKPGGWYMYFVDDDLVRVGRHKYRRCPHFLIPGILTSSTAPEFRGLSVINHMLDTAMLLNSFLTMEQNIGVLLAYPSWQKLVDANVALQHPEVYKPDASLERFLPGYIHTPAPGSKIEAIIPPGVNQHVKDIIDLLLGMLREIGLAPILRGVAGSDTSGYLANQLMTAARIGLHSIILNQSFAAVAMFLHMTNFIVDAIDETVYLSSGRGQSYRSIGVGPDELKPLGPHNVAVTINPLLPSNEIQRGQYGSSLVEGGHISEEYNREEFLGVAQPQRMQDQIDVEQAWNSEEMRAWRIKKAMKEAQADEEFEEEAAALEAERLAAEMEAMAPQAVGPAVPPEMAGAGGALAPTPGLGLPVSGLPPGTGPDGAPGGPNVGGGAGLPDLPAGGIGLPIGMPGSQVG